MRDVIRAISLESPPLPPGPCMDDPRQAQRNIDALMKKVWEIDEQGVLEPIPARK